MSRTPHGVALDLLNSMLGDLIIDFADDDVNNPWCSTGFARSVSSHRSCRRKNCTNACSDCFYVTSTAASLCVLWVPKFIPA